MIKIYSTRLFTYSLIYLYKTLLYISGSFQIHFVAPDGFETAAILLPQFLKLWGYRHAPPLPDCSLKFLN